MGIWVRLHYYCSNGLTIVGCSFKRTGLYSFEIVEEGNKYCRRGLLILKSEEPVGSQPFLIFPFI